MLLLHHNSYDMGGGIIEGCNLHGLEKIQAVVLWGIAVVYAALYDPNYTKFEARVMASIIAGRIKS
jgi:hypothetical protein